jgi:hypothetical protein
MKGNFLSDLVNFVNIVEFGKNCFICNGIRAYCMESVVFWKLHSERDEKNTEW